MVDMLSGRSGISLCIAHLLYSNINLTWFDAVTCISNTGVGVAAFKAFASGKSIIACDSIVKEKSQRQVESYGGFLNE